MIRVNRLSNKSFALKLLLTGLLLAPVAYAEPGIDSRPANPSCVAPERPETPGIQLLPVFSSISISGLMTIEYPQQDPSHLFALDNLGRVHRFLNDPATTQSSVPLNLESLIGDPTVDSQAGAMDMAFHPNFANNGYLYVGYTVPDPGRTSYVVRYTSTDGGETFGQPGDVVLSLEQPGHSHSLGSVFFGNDGYLYISFGDALSRPNGQNRFNLHGSILRIDVDSATPYAIPSDNPYANGGGQPEIYAYGFRNPFRVSQDSGGSGEIWAGDVGNQTWEEVSKVVKGGNHGWAVMEGSHCISPGCDSTGMIDPVYDYSHDNGCSVIGGHVYRGSAMPWLVGKYIFGDWCSGEITAVDDSGQQVVVDSLLMTGMSIQDFTVAPDGEIYVSDSVSQIMQLAPDAGGPPPDDFPQTLSETGCFDLSDPTQVVEGVIPYDVNTELWSDGAGKRRWLAIPDGTQIDVLADGDWDLPIGTVLIKEFSHNSNPFETRLMVRHDDGGWAGYTYEWNAALTDADLVQSGGLTKSINGQLDWTYPSRSQCMECHSQAAGRALGPETAQLNGDILYPSTGITSNQLETLAHINMFSNSLGGLPGDLPALSPIDDTNATASDLARSYLHANCANCHRPNGPGQGAMDLRFDVALEYTGTCDVTPSYGDLGVPGAKLITPGSPGSSVMSLRMHTRGVDQMPSLGTNLVDDDGTAALDAWITGLQACPASQSSGSGAYQPDPSGQFVIEAEHFDANTSAGDRDWVADSTPGFVGDSAMQSVPNTFRKATFDLSATSPRMDYEVEVPAGTTYNVWVRGLGLSGSRDSIWIGFDGDEFAVTDVSISRDSYGWSSAGQVTLSPGIHTVNVWMREDGSIVDRVLLTPLATTPSGDGPPESPRDGGGGGGPPPNDPPVLEPVGNQSATEDQALTFNVSASDADVPVLSADLSLLPGSPSFVDNNNGSGTFSWTPAIGDAPGPYSVTFTATDALDNSLTSAETISIDVQAASPGGGGGGGSGAYQPDGSGQFVMEAENFDANTSPGNRDWAPDFTAGYVGDSAMQSVPDSFTKVNSNLNANSPRMDYDVEVPTGTTYNVWIRGLGLSGSRDSLWVGANGNDGAAQVVSINRGSYGWSSGGQVTLGAGVQTINIWMREDGSIVDRILLTPLSSTPSGDGPPESTRGGGGGGPPPNSPPVLAPVGDQSATENQTLSFDVSASDADIPVLSADLSQLPGVPGFVDNDDGTGTFSWTPPEGAAPGPYSVTFTATDALDSSLTSSETISIDVQAAPPGGGGGGGSGAYQPDGSGQFVMEAEHFDSNNSAGIRDWVDDFTAGYVGDGAMQSVPNSFHKVTTDVNANSPRLDYQVELAAPATLNVWVRGLGLSGSRDSVWLGANGNDGAASNVSLTRGSYGWANAGQVTLGAGVQTINVWMREDGSIVDRILVTPLSTTPSGDGPAESPRGDGGASALPLSDDFADGNADGWTIVDDSTQFPSSWSVVNQTFVQSEHTNSNGTDVTETYHRGSYAIWDASAGLTDYRLSVDVTPGAESGDDIGVMFRYAGAGNYYRFTLNLLNGFARLEENLNGTYMTLASDHRGYTPGVQHTIVVEVEGPLMQVFVDGDPLFAASNNDHAAGSVALFSRDDSTFDNVSLTVNDSTAEIVIAEPEAYNVLPGAPLDIDVAAVARNAPATNASVQFQYHSGGTPALCEASTESSPGYFTAQCLGVPAGDYTVEALLLDDGAEVDRDSNAAVAVGSPASLSHRYDAIGDSISRGVGDNTASDNLAVTNPRVRSNSGWTALLSDLLVDATGAPNFVGNEAISGDRVTDAWNTRLFSIIERNPESDRALVMLGSNDSNTFITTSVADFTANLQNIIDELHLSGRDTVYVALLPPAWGRNTNLATIYPDPLDPSAERNQNTIDFNTAIQGMLPQSGVQLGPDFFSCFLTPTVNRFSLFVDPLHPNALGYRFMAALWRDAIMSGPVVAPMDPCPSPIYILEDLDAYAHGHKQNLLEEGDTYYTDESFTLTNIPPELNNGIWVMQANADNTNTDADFLSFDAGASPVTVYIAYDPAGVAPTSSTHTFTPVALSEELTVSDGAVGTFSIVAAASVTGNVTIGGNKSGSAPAAQQGYLVIVVQ